MESSQQKIIIIGAGPIGLATALLMDKLGCNVCVYESQNKVIDGDAPISDTCPIGLHARALHCLEVIDPQLRERAVAMSNLIKSKEYVAGNTAIHVDCGETFGTTRGALASILFEMCTMKRIPIMFGHSLVRIDPDKKQLLFNDNTNVLKTIDCTSYRIICCDGGNSMARTSLENITPGLKCSSIAWNRDFRFIFARENPEVNVDLDTSVQYMFNSNSVFAIKDSNNEYIWVIGLSIDSEMKTAESKALLSKDASNDNIEFLKTFLKENCPRVLPLLTNECYSNFFRSKPYQGSIVSLNRFNIDEWMLFLGDAAHTLLPPEHNEGVNCGLEDAETLFRIMQSTTSNIFARYNEQRQSDIKSLIDISMFMNDSMKTTESSETKSRYLFYTVENFLKKIGIFKDSCNDYFSSKSIIPYSEIADKWFSRQSLIMPVCRLVVRPVDKIFSYISSIKGTITGPRKAKSN